MGISNILSREREFDVVGEAADGRSAVEMVSMVSPNIVLMDLSLPAPRPRDDPADRREFPAMQSVVMAQDEDEESLFASIKAGAAAFVIKDART